jgi:hypothetical protein
MNLARDDWHLPTTLSVHEAASLLGMTAGGLRGAILRGRLLAEKDARGCLTIRSHELAAFHLYGDRRLVPDEQMSRSKQTALHRYLETVCRV